MNNQLWLTATFYDNRDGANDRKVAFFLFDEPEDYRTTAQRDTGKAETLLTKAASKQLRTLFGVKGGRVSLGSIDAKDGEWTIFLDHVIHKDLNMMLEDIEAGREVDEEAYDKADLYQTWNVEGMFEFNHPDLYACYMARKNADTSKQKAWYNWLSENGVPLLPATDAVKAKMKVTQEQIEAKRREIWA